VIRSRQEDLKAANILHSPASESLLMNCLSIVALVSLTTVTAIAEPVPSARQLKWHEIELFGMINFSTVTYYGKEWGCGDEDAGKAARFDLTVWTIEQAESVGK
jgi:hypothetical protein